MDNGHAMFSKLRTVIENTGHSQTGGNHLSLESEHHHDESRLSNTILEFQSIANSRKIVFFDNLPVSEFSRFFWQPPKVS